MHPLTGKSLKIVIYLILVAILSVAIILLEQSNEVKSNGAFVGHTNEVLYQTQKVFTATTENKIIVRDFLVSGNNVYLQQLQASETAIAIALSKLRQLTAD